jgi:hypothetical protein
MRGVSFSVVMRLLARLPRNMSSILGREVFISLLHRVHAASGATRPPIQGKYVLSPKLKRPEPIPAYSPSFNIEVNNAWSPTSTPLPVFIVWCLIKGKDNFFFSVHKGISFASASWRTLEATQFCNVWVQGKNSPSPGSNRKELDLHAHSSPHVVLMHTESAFHVIVR